MIQHLPAVLIIVGTLAVWIFGPLLILVGIITGLKYIVRSSRNRH
jgi:hypothetical protein